MRKFSNFVNLATFYLFVYNPLILPNFFPMSLPLILASGSPRRKQLLTLLDRPFESHDHTFDEEVLPEDISPIDIPQYLAEKKAASLQSNFPSHIIIGSDTVVLLGDTILGKPKTRANAVTMLEQLSGTNHQIITGYCVLNTQTGLKNSGKVITQINMKTLSLPEIEHYLQREDVLGIAGAYDHEHKGAILIESLQGDFYASIGFPLSKIYDAIQEVENL